MRPVVLCAALLMAQHISVDVDLVVFNVTVLESRGHRVEGLSRDNFRIFEDGIEQRIQFVGREDVPATVGLVIDNSGSMRRKQADVLRAAQEFRELIHPQDELFAFNFNERVFAGLPQSGPDGKTALYDAVLAALKQVDAGTHQRKALVVFSDGGDNASSATLDEVLHAAENSSAAIYTIGIFQPGDKDRNPKVLRQIARLTDGEAYLPERLDEVHEIWRRIAASIRTQYTIGYVPANSKHDGTFRTVRVSASGPDGKPLRVRARRGYVAPAIRGS
jgi:Ca-activated chloride channel homolog